MVPLIPTSEEFSGNQIRELTWADPEGGDRGPDPPPPLKNHKNIGFLSNSDPDPLKNYKATEPAFNVGLPSGRQRTPFKWRFAGGPMMARL